MSEHYSYTHSSAHDQTVLLFSSRESSSPVTMCHFHRISFAGTHIVGPDCSRMAPFTFVVISSGMSPVTTATKRQDTSYNSYKKTGYFIQQLKRDRTLHTTATKRQDTSYNSYKKTGYFIQQLQRYRTLHTTATKRQDISYKSYKETGHFIQQLQRDRTLPTTAAKRQDTSYNSYKETGHFIQQFLTQKLQEYIDYQKPT